MSMSDTYDWTERVGQLTSSSVYHQLSDAVRDAQEMLDKFTASTSEQGGLLLDAQREMEQTFERRMNEMAAEIRKELESIRVDLATLLALVRGEARRPALTAVES